MVPNTVEFGLPSTIRRDDLVINDYPTSSHTYKFLLMMDLNKKPPEGGQ